MRVMLSLVDSVGSKMPIVFFTNGLSVLSKIEMMTSSKVFANTMVEKREEKGIKKSGAPVDALALKILNHQSSASYNM